MHINVKHAELPFTNPQDRTFALEKRNSIELFDISDLNDSSLRCSLSLTACHVKNCVPVPSAGKKAPPPRSKFPVIVETGSEEANILSICVASYFS